VGLLASYETFTALQEATFFYVLVFGAAAAVVSASVRRRRDGWPFYMLVPTFTSAFGTLAISFRPCMIPSAITVDQAAAPHSNHASMFWNEGLCVFPLMPVHTVIRRCIFRGKVKTAAGHY
jgi:cytochrome bd ubiquinol oxidase subunit II